MTSATRRSAAADRLRQDGLEMSGSLIDSTNLANLPTLQIYQSWEFYRAPPAASESIRSVRHDDPTIAS
jgi:hypothetical protein